MLINIPRFFVFVIVFLVLNLSVFSADTCEYRGEIEQCVKANDLGKSKSIEDFVCIVGPYEKIVYQVVLDKEFQKLDEEMEKYIFDLEKNKNVYFGKDRQGTYIDGINDIYNKRKYFYREYKKLCPIIVAKSTSCTDDNSTSILNAKGYLSDEYTLCMSMIKKKLEIYDDVTFGVMMFNKEQIKKDYKKLYDQGARRNYNKLIDLMMIHLGYIERIWQKLPSFTKNTY